MAGRSFERGSKASLWLIIKALSHHIWPHAGAGSIEFHQGNQSPVFSFYRPPLFLYHYGLQRCVGIPASLGVHDLLHWWGACVTHLANVALGLSGGLFSQWGQLQLRLPEFELLAIAMTIRGTSLGLDVTLSSSFV